MFAIDTYLIAHITMIFIRISAIIFSLPFFGDQPVPLRSRILLSVALTLVITPIIPANMKPDFSLEPIALTTAILSEILIGVSIGFVARAIFHGLIFAASIVGFQMGFGTANLIVPDADTQTNSFTAFHRIIVLLIFLSLNLREVFIQAIYQSFLVIKSGAGLPDMGLTKLMIQASASLFSIGIQLAAPVLIALLFSMAALGIMARAVPQMNVFVISFPVSFYVGMFVYLATLPYFPGWLKTYFIEHTKSIFKVINAYAPI